jgi:hypothetical protein
MFLLKINKNYQTLTASHTCESATITNFDLYLSHIASIEIGYDRNKSKFDCFINI